MKEFYNVILKEMEALNPTWAKRFIEKRKNYVVLKFWAIIVEFPEGMVEWESLRDYHHKVQAIGKRHGWVEEVKMESKAPIWCPTSLHLTGNLVTVTFRLSIEDMYMAKTIGRF